MDKYAIIRSGSKQYRVKPGDVIDVELLDAEKKGNIEFKDILFYTDGSQGKVGAKALANALVKGEVLDLVRGPKVIAYKYKKRKKYRRKVGHRQHYTRVRITELAI